VPALEENRTQCLGILTDYSFKLISIFMVGFFYSLVGFSQCMFSPGSDILSAYDIISTSGNIAPSSDSDYYVCSNIDIEYSGSGFHNYWLESGASYVHNGIGTGNIFALNNNQVELVDGNSEFTVYAATGSTVIISSGVNLIYAECGSTIINNSNSTTVLYECIEDITNSAPIADLIQCFDISLNFPSSPGNVLSIGGAQFVDCEDFPITLDASSLIGPYNWSTGETSSAIQINEVGIYTCAVPSLCGLASATSIIRLEEPVETIILGYTLNFCELELPFVLDAGPQYENYLWNTGETTQTITVDTYGTYSVSTEGLCQDGQGEIILIGFTDPAPFTTPDTFDGCNYDFPLTLTTGNYNTYIWNTGETTPNIEVNSIDTYEVTVTNYCGSETYTYDLGAAISAPIPILPEFAQYCNDDFPLTIGVNDIFDSYSWSTSEITPTISISGPGIYGLEVTTDCGTGYDELIIESLGDAPDLFLGEDLNLCDIEFPVALDALTIYDSYLWSTGEESTSILLDQPQFISLEVSNACGTSTDGLTISSIGGLPLLELGPDLSFCLADFPVEISAQEGDSYLWSTNEETQSIILNSPQSISVEVTNTCGTTSDDISITSLGDIPEINLSLDQAFCDYDFPITLDAGLGYDSYTWGNSETTQTTQLSGPSIITLEIANICGSSSEEISVTSLGTFPSLDLGEDLSLCNLEFPVVIDAGIFETYNWSNSASSQTIELSSPQTISIEVSNSCGTDTDEIIISSLGDLPDLNLGEDRSFCDAEFPVLIDAGAGFNTYLWNNNETSQTLELAAPASVSVEVTNICGSSFDEIEISSSGNTPQVNLGGYLAVCDEDFPIILNPGNYDSYLWSSGEESQQLIINSPEIVSITVTSPCGTAFDEKTIASLGTAPSLELGEDMSLCNADFPITLDGGSNGISYIWSTGEETPLISVDVPSVISVEVENQCGLSSDNIIITSAGDIPILDLGGELSYCEAEFPVMISSPIFDSYTWSNGDLSQETFVNQPQSITLEVSNICGTVSDELTISSLGDIPNLDLGEDLNYCLADFPVQIECGIYDSYLWSTNENTPSISINEPQSISLEVTNICGTNTDDLNIGVLPHEESLVNLLLCEDGTLSYQDVTITEPGTYNFISDNGASNGCELLTEVNVSFVPQETQTLVINLDESETYEFNGVIYDQEGSYFFTENQLTGCDIDIELIINYLDNSVVTYIPNAFSPNYDGLNDVFQPIVKLGDNVELISYKFLIFNRYGEIVFSSEDYSQSRWNGGFGNEGEYFVQNGIYNWTLQFNTTASSYTQNFNGFVNIVR
jgi:gliding motility-associated-like protein